ncbi:hypothetical protein SAMN05216284_11481 [Micromonospora sediminimaris]|nr:hypothetical protein SAMN05216284_11481 [Micromonospora sediminimaris]
MNSSSCATPGLGPSRQDPHPPTRLIGRSAATPPPATPAHPYHRIAPRSPRRPFFQRCCPPMDLSGQQPRRQRASPIAISLRMEVCPTSQTIVVALDPDITTDALTASAADHVHTQGHLCSTGLVGHFPAHRRLTRRLVHRLHEHAPADRFRLLDLRLMRHHAADRADWQWQQWRCVVFGIPRRSTLVGISRLPPCGPRRMADQPRPTGVPGAAASAGYDCLQRRIPAAPHPHDRTRIVTGQT